MLTKRPKHFSYCPSSYRFLRSSKQAIQRGTTQVQEPSQNESLRLHLKHLDCPVAPTTHKTRPPTESLPPRRHHRTNQPLVPRQPQPQRAAQARRDAERRPFSIIPGCEERGLEAKEEVSEVRLFGQGGGAVGLESSSREDFEEEVRLVEGR